MKHGNVYEMRQPVPILFGHFQNWVAGLPRSLSHVITNANFYEDDGAFVATVEIEWSEDFNNRRNREAADGD